MFAVDEFEPTQPNLSQIMKIFIKKKLEREKEKTISLKIYIYSATRDYKLNSISFISFK